MVWNVDCRGDDELSGQFIYFSINVSQKNERMHSDALMSQPTMQIKYSQHTQK